MTAKDILPEGGNPFSINRLNVLFEPLPNNPSRLLKKESNNVEYKRTFHFQSFDDHARTFAAYANTKGGYFVFGVDDKTRELIGLQDDRFDRLDPTIPTQFLNKKFAPEIHWVSHIHAHGKKQFGLIYVYPSVHKPVIALESGTRIIEGQIFYRYNGSTETIKYPELRQLMEDIRRTEQELWLRHLRRLATIGVENAAVFSFEDGTAHGKSGSFIIDAELLPQIQFLREGEFVERIGAPAIKIVGEAEVLTAGIPSKKQSRLTAMALTEPDILSVFLKQEVPQAPAEYIKVMSSFNSVYVPLYYFAHLADMTLANLESFIDKSQATGKQALITRIYDDVPHHRYYQLPKTSEAIRLRMQYVNAINQAQIDLSLEYDPVILLQSIQLLSGNEIHVDYLFPVVHQMFQRHWEETVPVRTWLRKAICHLDYEIFRPRLDTNTGPGIVPTDSS